MTAGDLAQLNGSVTSGRRLDDLSPPALLAAAQFKNPMTPVTGPLPVSIWTGQVAPGAYTSLSAMSPPSQMTRLITYNDVSQVFFPSDVFIQGTTALIAAEDALVQQNIALWELDIGGGPLLVNFAVYGNSSESLSNPQIAPLGSLANSSVIAWVDNTSSGTEVLASTVGCF